MRYLVYDVFTDRPFGGNPLAIFPDASSLAPALMQPIAREFGFSETIFLFPEDGDVRVRIFTPTQEIPFAGHPLIGSLVALHDEGAPDTVTIHTGVGPIAGCVADGVASFRREAEVELLHTPDPALVARCLSIDPAAIAEVTIASAGLPFALTELSDRETLSRTRPDLGAFREASALYPLPFDFSVYAYVREGETIHARMFAPLDDIPEDPATGSAATVLALYLAKGGSLNLEIRQGEDMARPSLIRAEAAGGAVIISGRAVRVMEGRLTV
ncbi:PhzF family phenazine biosynthesis protein [Palleronia sp.]|uniref:PhzF family phenazine biosynthesis protein n=1 Tax=Palleronia sp. TaxID=1940284 RepID=UPI0035C7A2E3